MKKRERKGSAQDPELDQEDLAARSIVEGLAEDHEDDTNVDTENFHEPGSEEADLSYQGRVRRFADSNSGRAGSGTPQTGYVYWQHLLQRSASSGI